MLCFAFVVPRLRIDMSIVHFLPRGTDPALSDMLAALSETPQARTLIVQLRSETQSDVVDVTERYMARLKGALPDAEVRSGLPAEAQEAMFAYLASSPPSAFLLPEDYEAGRLAQAGGKLKDELGGAMGPFVAQLAPSDPLLSRVAVLREFGDFATHDLVTSRGILVSVTRAEGYVFITPRASSLDGDAQAKLLRETDLAFEQVRTPDLRMRKSGVARYAVVAERQIRGDIERIGTLSTLGIIVFFVLLFRSPRMLALGFVPLICGSVVATLGTALVFGHVHGVTLAFGSSLLGVGIDYAEHYYTHYALSPEAGPVRTMRHVWPGLLLGAVTTAVGLSGLMLADFPGALQMGLFSILSVLAALVATRVLLPPWMPEPYVRPALPLHLERWGLAVVGWLSRARARKLVWILVLPAIALGLARVRFNDDPRALVPSEPGLLDEDRAIGAAISAGDAGRFAVVLGAGRGSASLADATARLARADAELREARTKGLLRSFPPLGRLLRPRAEQLQSAQLAHASSRTLLDALATEGFVRDKFAPYADEAAARLREPLAAANVGPTPDELLGSPVAPLLQPFVTRLGDQYALVLPLGGVDNVAALTRAVPSATIVDQGALLQDAFAHVRSRVLGLLLGGLVAVMALLWIRYRTLRATCVAILPAMLAVLGTLAGFGLFGVKLTVMHVMGFALVLSMGADYGIFIVESKDEPKEVSRALVSIVVATMTTLLSFGLLALSRNPALAGLGASISLGMMLSVLFCPLVWVALRGRMATPVTAHRDG